MKHIHETYFGFCKRGHASYLRSADTHDVTFYSGDCGCFHPFIITLCAKHSELLLLARCSALKECFHVSGPSGRL